MLNPVAALALERLRIAARGAVQGVGFRPFVYRLATELGLAGWVHNSPQGVAIEVEGPRPRLEQFLLRLEAERPPHSRIQSLEPVWLDPVGYTEFTIRPSAEGGAKTALVLPDIATCSDCLREIFNPADRRYRYPFTNCTHCGPRFSLIEALPYDRSRTSMKQFIMCPQCQAEYDDPGNRRFHAQPNACPVCGPHLELWYPQGGCARESAADAGAAFEPLAHERDHAALLAAAQALRQGQIVAVKGLGGFHLMVAAADEAAVRRLRQRKHREEKPFALMFPSMEQVRRVCEVSDLEARLLRSAEAPIVLLRWLDRSAVAAAVAPGNPYLGVMLPYTPLHHLLLAELGFPVVATSGNLSDEPICTDEREALQRLRDIADVFLVHNRPIVRHVDDSIVRVVRGRELVLRRARGYAPWPITLPPAPVHAREESAPTAPASAPSILGVGAHLKNTVALVVGAQAFISQHIGDLETAESYAALQRVAADLQQLYEAPARLVAADLHPDYLSTRFARQTGLPVVPVQHHYAHVLACMAENDLQPPVLGVAWDGTGYGPDGTIWGGEFLRVTATGFERVAHLRTFGLPGGDQAVREPRRAALGLLHEVYGDEVFGWEHLHPVRACSATERATFRHMLARGLNCPRTSSAGRLFDAVASLTGLRQQSRFEGQAAMELEFAARDDEEGLEPYPFALRTSAETSTASPLVLDWAPLVRAMVEDLRQNEPLARLAARFHRTLAEMIIAAACRLSCPSLALTGGCFQNRRLVQAVAQRAQAQGLKTYWHQRVPPNDGGIALGQVIEARRVWAQRQPDPSPPA